MNLTLLAAAIANYEAGEVITPEEEAQMRALHIDPTNVAKMFITEGYVEWVVWWKHPITGRVYFEERRRTLDYID